MRILSWLLTVLLVGLGALCLLPSSAPYTRWKLFSVLRFSGASQTFYDYVVGTSASDRALQDRTARIRQSHRDEFAVQWALALAEGATNPQRTRERLLVLRERFPNRPEVYASLLRNEMRQFPLGRAEENYFGGRNAPAPAANREAVQRVLAWARQGEQLDPSNAFFTGMRVIALLAQRRDTEAIRALQRAAQQPLWNDYLSAEAEATVQTQRLLRSLRSGEIDLAISTSILFPHLAKERSIGRVLIVRAWELERQGKYREALAIRLALARYGQRMTEGGGIMRTLVGVSLMQMAAAPPRTSEQLSAEQRQQRFLTTLERNGFHKEAAWFRAELQRAQTIRALLREATPALFDKQIITTLRRYCGQLLNFFALLGLALMFGIQWLILGLIYRARKGAAFAVGGLLSAWAVAALMFVLSDAGALMGRMLASVRAAEQMILGQEVSSLPAWSPALLRWALPAGTAVIGLVLSGLAVLYAVAKRAATPEGTTRTLWASISALLAATLAGLTLLAFLNWRADVQLERFAWGLRHEEVAMALRAAGHPPSLPPPKPTP